MIGEIRVLIVSASGCPPVDTNGKADPYLILSLEGQKHTTSVKKASLNPVWNEEVRFEVKSPYSQIHIELWDKDIVHRDRLIANCDVAYVDSTISSSEVDVIMASLFDSEEDIISLSLKLQWKSDVATTPVKAALKHAFDHALDEGGKGEEDSFSFRKSNASMNRLSACVKSVFDLIDAVNGIMTWQSISSSLIVWLCFFAACLWPSLLLVAPLILLVVYIFQKRTKKGTLLILSDSHVSVGQRVRNMTSIQNATAQFCDLNDMIFDVDSNLLSWENTVITRRILNYLIFGTVITIAAVSTVPLNLLILGGGTVFFAIGNSDLRRLLSDSVPSLISAVQPESKQEIEYHEVICCFENQRWWLGRGWTSSMIPTDFPAWSNDDGTLDRSKEDAERDIPFGYHWSTDWGIDTSVGDDQGWQYGQKTFTSAFQNASKRGSYVRRRKWVRTMCK